MTAIEIVIDELVVRGLSTRAQARVAAAALEARLAALAGARRCGARAAEASRRLAPVDGGSPDAARRRRRRRRLGGDRREQRPRRTHAATHAAEVRGAARVAAAATATSARPSAPRTSSRAAAASRAGRSRRCPPCSACSARRSTKREERRREEEGGAEEGGRGGARDAAGPGAEGEGAADPLVKTVKDAVTSPAGIVVTGAALAGGVAALAATGKELPFQPPAIPLDKITARPLGAGHVRGAVDRADLRRADAHRTRSRGRRARRRSRTTRAARDGAAAAAFQRTIRYAPGSKEAEEQRLTSRRSPAYVAQNVGTARRSRSRCTPPPQVEPKKEEPKTPVQPAPASPSAAPPAHANVDGALATPGPPARPATRRSMEARFGYDFSRRSRPRRRARRRDGGGDRRGSVHRRRGHRVRSRPLRPGQRRRQPAARARARRTSRSRSRARCRARSSPDARPLPESTRRELETRFGRAARRRPRPHGRGGTSRRRQPLGARRCARLGRLLRLGCVGAGHRSRQPPLAARGGAPFAGEAFAPAWPEAVLEAEAQLAATYAAARSASAAAPRPGSRSSSRRSSSTVGGNRGTSTTRSSSTNCGRARPRRVWTPFRRSSPTSRTDTSALTQFRIVGARQPVQPLPTAPDRRRGTDYANLNALGLQTQPQLATELGNRSHRHERRDGPRLQLAVDGQGGGAAPHAARADGGADGDAAGVRLVGRRRALRRERQGVRSGTARRRPPPTRQTSRRKVPDAQDAVKPLAAAALPEGDKADSTSCARGRSARFAKAGWTWTVTPGDDQGEARPLLAAGHGTDPA